jgi:predicted dehydrogenase
MRVAVIGVGHMGSLHVQKWLRHPEVELVGMYDIDRDRLQQLSREYGVQPLRSLEEAFQVAEAVTIATPSRTHAEIARRALEAGCHCLVEKPLATTVAEAEELRMRAERCGCILMAGHVERFNPAFLWLRAQGVVPRFVEVHRLHPFRPRAVDVSVVLDVMIHDLDLLLVLLQCGVERWEAHGVAVLTELPDIANVRLVFANGCVANITASRVSAKFLRKMRLFQPSSYIALDFAAQVVEQIRVRVGVEGEGEDEECVARWSVGGQQRVMTRRLLRLPASDPLWEEQRVFLQAIRSREPALAGLEQTVEALRIAEQIEQSLQDVRLA